MRKASSSSSSSEINPAAVVGEGHHRVRPTEWCEHVPSKVGWDCDSGHSFECFDTAAKLVKGNERLKGKQDRLGYWQTRKIPLGQSAVQR